ncbi:DNA polymerase III subunit delta [Legionella sp. 16cNR16C]|uniref:DNA polymerase III subunit delta n=1 Tax=Legionella sp. 16cNR16C TaxID=2905656 RepID=UPI001E533DA4|nr:DNA polymerase III subunit delta [Legionella sp. 16cNR16C]MCE3045003.1 DNA polymerase III subunit delta [Legionella sp. 16cNR16C]
MLNKLNHLNLPAPDKFLPVYLITGQEPFQVNHYARVLISAWQTRHKDDCDTKVLQINSTADWTMLREEANNFSLFSSMMILDVRYDKKTLDSAGKQFLETYLSSPNPQCLLVLRAPDMSLKALQFISSHPAIMIIAASPMSANSCKEWIASQLKQHSIDFDEAIPALIYQYNENNLPACAQVLEKIKLIAEANTRLTLKEVEEHLHNQCEFLSFELADACLLANQAKALLLLRQSSQNKTEPSLILWILSQEIRLLIQLKHKTAHCSFRDAASQLKIWSTKLGNYQTAIKRFEIVFLVQLLNQCELLDKKIKSANQPGQIWRSLEIIAMALCTGRKAGYLE